MASAAFRQPDRDPSEARLLTVDEFLAYAEQNDGRMEYVAGRVYAMAQSTGRHGKIAINILGRLWMVARGTPCSVYPESVFVRAGSDRLYLPDVMVHCGPEPTERADGGMVVDDPSVIVEVTSPSTARTDRTEKLDAYLGIASLQSYLIVEQGRRFVERHWRDGSGAWQEERVVGVGEGGRVPFPRPEVVLTLDEIYEGVRFDPPTRLRIGEREVDAYVVPAAAVA